MGHILDQDEVKQQLERVICLNLCN